MRRKKYTALTPTMCNLIVSAFVAKPQLHGVQEPPHRGGNTGDEFKNTVEFPCGNSTPRARRRRANKGKSTNVVIIRQSPNPLPTEPIARHTLIFQMSAALATRHPRGDDDLTRTHWSSPRPPSIRAVRQGKVKTIFAGGMRCGSLVLSEKLCHDLVGERSIVGFSKQFIHNLKRR